MGVNSLLGVALHMTEGVPSKSKRRTREFIFMGMNSLLGVALHMTEGVLYRTTFIRRGLHEINC
ncbi:hypothetical protein PsalMR5_01038 [Piscirickettsia salmonis]|uniref:hypothetical protein n=1 Tax=Piscirickettsia salmonis TaxID=1238 RepID=UPI0018ACCB2E|nr:hypothetical protein [Piscirickettsia salmonis]QGP53620.1 hypothetical protein PsalSR1_01034 [Piscirickettsia salmonis]QGP60468.1 hypothetical protein PsalBI1_03083 [Piscirickettsia salmonis]QGP63191.1 hypothetical protein PsalMR5_01038 [Piscirickettsia salmonis]